jgi:uncharacterized membrane protein YoaK (UPF0700 family)
VWKGLSHSYTPLNFGVYASFMSGNTTSAGLHIGQSNLAAAEHSLSSDSVFCSQHLRLPLGSRAESGIRGSLGQLDPAVAALMLVVFAMLDRPAISGV